jgi:hypothetical protein
MMGDAEVTEVLLEPVSKESMSRLRGVERAKAIKNYHLWLEKVRLQDKVVAKHQVDREKCFLNREHLREYRKKYMKNPVVKEKVNAYHKEYYSRPENIVKHRACARRYYLEHREKLREYLNEYYSKHKEKSLAKSREYYQKNKEKINQRQRLYHHYHYNQEKAKAYYSRPDVKARRRAKYLAKKYLRF